MALISTDTASESHAFAETTSPLDRRIVNQCTGVKHEGKADVCKRNLVLNRRVSRHMVVDRSLLLGNSITVTEQDNVAMFWCIRNELISLWLVRYIPDPPIDEDLVKTRRTLSAWWEGSPA